METFKMVGALSLEPHCQPFSIFRRGDSATTFKMWYPTPPAPSAKVASAYWWTWGKNTAVLRSFSPVMQAQEEVREGGLLETCLSPVSGQ
jgi:hypothetical protein